MTETPFAVFVAVALLIGGVFAAGSGLLRSYGLVFLIINAYTFYFQFLVVNSAGVWWIHPLLTGGSLLALGYWLERRIRTPQRSESSYRITTRSLPLRPNTSG